jgi:hypothetical protein
LWPYFAREFRYLPLPRDTDERVALHGGEVLQLAMKAE